VFVAVFCIVLDCLSGFFGCFVSILVIFRNIFPTFYIFKNRTGFMSHKPYRKLLVELDFFGLLEEVMDYGEPESKILESEHWHQLNKWTRGEALARRWQLRFRRTRDGGDVRNFHRCCDGWTPTLLVAQSDDGSIFGAFSRLDWGTNDEPQKHDDVWLFSLVRGGHESEPHRMLCNEPSCALGPFRRKNPPMFSRARLRFCFVFVFETHQNSDTSSHIGFVQQMTFFKVSKSNLGHFDLPPGINFLFFVVVIDVEIVDSEINTPLALFTDSNRLLEVEVFSLGDQFDV
jgi:hypothetical protein